MSKFETTFFEVLKEAEVPPEVPNADAQMTDAQAFDAGLEPGTAPDTFNVEPSAPGLETRYVEKAKEWIEKLEGFAQWVNGMDNNSLNKQFNTLDREGTAFEGISKNSNTLVKIAEDLAALAQTIKGHVLGAGKKETQPQS